MRLLNNLTRMQRRLLGEEELELLPFVGKWAPQAALLRDQLALLCVLSYETKKTLWMQETSRCVGHAPTCSITSNYQCSMSGYLESLELLQEQHRQFEVTQLLSTLDHHWSRFLLVTRSLKEGVNVRAYSNLNATVEYSLDLTVLFDDMLHSFRCVCTTTSTIGMCVRDTVPAAGRMPCGSCLLGRRGYQRCCSSFQC